MSTIADKMKEANGVIESVAKGMSESSTYVTFIEFQVGASTFTAHSSDRTQGCIMSLDYVKNGSGNANDFTLRIAFAPHLGEDWDANRMESAILGAVSSNGKSFSSRYCRMRYGYRSVGNSGSTLVTPWYEGLLLDYTCEIQNGMLLYTLTGYSSMCWWGEDRDSLELSINYEEGDGEQSAGGTAMIKPTYAAQQIVEKYLKNDDEKKTHYVCEFDGEDVKGSDALVPLPSLTDMNPAQALTELLSSAMYESQAKALEEGKTIPPEEKVTYGWYCSDSNDGSDESVLGTIHIYMHDPTKEAEKEDDENTLTFNWLTPKTSDDIGKIVLDFRPEFNGKVLFSKATSKLNSSHKNEDGTDANAKDLFTGQFFVNNKGELEATSRSISPSIGGTAEEVNTNAAMESSSWVHDLQYPYKATMQTVGIPHEIPITGVIRVNPLIYNKQHHSAGRYEVLKITDKIDSGGLFTTTWELIKISPTNPPASEEQE